MAQSRLRLSRRQLGAFLEDFEAIKQFENLFATVDATVVGGGNTYDDLPQTSPATIAVTLSRIVAQLEAIATAYPGADKAWSKKSLAEILTRLEALETEYPGNTKAWVVKQRFLVGGKVDSFNTRTGAVTLSSVDVTGALTFTPINKAGDTGIGTLSTDKITVTVTSGDSALFGGSGSGGTAVRLNNTHANNFGSVVAFQAASADTGYLGALGTLLGTTNHDMTVWGTTGNGWRVYVNGGSIRMLSDSTGTTFTGNMGFQGNTPIAKPALNVAAVDPATTMALVNQIRTALINYGLCS